MTDKANTEHLDLFHESLLAALDTNLPAKLKQTMQGLEADATAVRSGSLSVNARGPTCTITISWPKRRGNL